MTIGDRLKQLRINGGYTQEKIAEILRVKRQTYSAWERNISKPDTDTILFLADYYDVDTDYIMGRCDIPKKPTNMYDVRISNLSDEKKRIIDTILNELERTMPNENGEWAALGE